MCSFLPSTVLAQEPGISSGETLKQPAPGNEELSLAPAKVNVKPVNRDEEILKRLQNVLDATEWFIDPKVRVEEGVVFLSGQTETPELKKWAGDLARYHSIAPLYRFWTAHPGIVRGGRDIGHTRNESVS